MTGLQQAARAILRRRCAWQEAAEVEKRAVRDCESVLAAEGEGDGDTGGPGKGPAETTGRAGGVVKVNGTREEVWNGVALKTRAGLRKSDLREVVSGRRRKIVSRRMSDRAKKSRFFLREGQSDTSEQRHGGEGPAARQHDGQDGRQDGK